MMEEKNGRLYFDSKPYRSKNPIGEFISDNMKFCVFVYNAEWNKKPHFHICSEDKSIKCAIGIYEPIYVSHKKYKGRLNKQQIIDMMEWLQRYEYSPLLMRMLEFTNWEDIRSGWNSTEANHIQPEKSDDDWMEDLPLPDYLQLLEY